MDNVILNLNVHFKCSFSFDLCNGLQQCFSNHGSPRLCGWVAKPCKLPHVKEKDLRAQDLRSEEPS